jgi:hypothetical protein
MTRIEFFRAIAKENTLDNALVDYAKGQVELYDLNNAKKKSKQSDTDKKVYSFFKEKGLGEKMRIKQVAEVLDVSNSAIVAAIKRINADGVKIERQYEEKIAYYMLVDDTE